MLGAFEFVLGDGKDLRDWEKLVFATVLPERVDLHGGGNLPGTCATVNAVHNRSRLEDIT